MEIIGKKVRLREKLLSDAHDDYGWQRDPELAHFDGIAPTKLAFEQYFENYKREMRYYKTASRHVFGIETLDGIHIGNSAFYDIDEDLRETELGILIGNREYWNKGYGAETVCLLVDYIFQKTRLRRIHLKTLEENKRAQESFKKCGFVPYVTMQTDGFAYVLMEFTYRAWMKRQSEKETEA
jgi:RimJ/RimL family protein N-acetyltransferase